MNKPTPPASEAPTHAPRKRYSAARVGVYLALGLIAAYVFNRTGTASHDANELLAQAQAAENPAGEYKAGASAAHVLGLGAGYVLTLRVTGCKEFPEKGFLIAQRALGETTGQLLPDRGEGEPRLITREETERYLKLLGVDLAPWDALCEKTRAALSPSAPGDAK